MTKFILLLTLQILFTASVFSQSVIKAGETAPALSVDEWIKGEPVSDFQEGTVYLVEFWGTWCSPCIKNIPHLSELQKKYADKGLVVIGVATHEFNGREGLMEFMNERGDEMEYKVAYDTDLSMQSEWDSGNKDGDDFRLPVCYLIDGNRKVVFEGHPENENLESLIISTLAGN